MRYAFLLHILLLGCTNPSTDPEDTDSDTDTDTDTGPLAGQGVISGDCGDIDASALNSESPSIFSNTLDFQSALDEDDLTDGGAEILEDGNLGGSSIWSEVFAFEILYRCEGAILQKTEAEILYKNPDGKKTDLLVTLDDTPIGVSVTRAYGWPPEDPYTIEQATELLEDKLADIPISSANASDENPWQKQILHILAYTPDHAVTVENAWNGLDANVTLDTIVVVTATEGDDEFMY